jgi:hypothetical protein
VTSKGPKKRKEKRKTSLRRWTMHVWLGIFEPYACDLAFALVPLLSRDGFRARSLRCKGIAKMCMNSVGMVFLVREVVMGK